MKDAPAKESEPPELPQAEPERFQFSIRQLLAYMAASAVLAALLRWTLQWLQSLPQADEKGLPAVLAPQHWLLGLPNMILAGLAMGGLLYFFLRTPFLIHQVSRMGRRWRTIQQHRSALETWAGEQRGSSRRKAGQPEPPPPD